MEQTRSLLPGIAAAAKVDPIVIGTLVYPTDAEVVDVTEQYITALGANAATRMVIQAIREKDARAKAK